MNNSKALMIIPPKKAYIVEPKFIKKKGQIICDYCNCYRADTITTPDFDDNNLWCNCWHTKDGKVILIES